MYFFKLGTFFGCYQKCQGMIVFIKILAFLTGMDYFQPLFNLKQLRLKTSVFCRYIFIKSSRLVQLWIQNLGKTRHSWYPNLTRLLLSDPIVSESHIPRKTQPFWYPNMTRMSTYATQIHHYSLDRGNRNGCQKIKIYF